MRSLVLGALGGIRWVRINECLLGAQYLMGERLHTGRTLLKHGAGWKWTSFVNVGLEPSYMEELQEMFKSHVLWGDRLKWWYLYFQKRTLVVASGLGQDPRKWQSELKAETGRLVRYTEMISRQNWEDFADPWMGRRGKGKNIEPLTKVWWSRRWNRFGEGE